MNKKELTKHFYNLDKKRKRMSKQALKVTLAEQEKHLDHYRAQVSKWKAAIMRTKIKLAKENGK